MWRAASYEATKFPNRRIKPPINERLACPRFSYVLRTRDWDADNSSVSWEPRLIGWQPLKCIESLRVIRRFSGKFKARHLDCSSRPALRRNVERLSHCGDGSYGSNFVFR